jgi:small subunit ribosomal protein S1
MAENESFAALFAQSERQRRGETRGTPQVGQRLRGRIVSIGPERAFVDVGDKAEASLDLAELGGGDGTPQPQVGDTIEAQVLARDPDTGALTLGTGHGRRPQDGAGLQEAYASGLPVQGLVTGVTKGGLEVQVAGLRGFCPASQADLRFVEDLQGFVGQHLNFRVTRLEGGRRPNVVLSRKALLEEERQALAAETRARLEVGAVLSGTVTRVQDFGAFVDLGGVEGLIHVSELAPGRVSHPREVVAEGQAVEVAVLRIERVQDPRRPEKIALSIRALAPDPWADAASRFPPGARADGRVTRLQPFGAFVELAPGLEGLVHISELGAGRRVTHPHEVLSPGDSVTAVILEVDPARHRISLSLDPDRQAAPAAPERTQTRPEPPAAPAVGSFGALLQETLRRGR